MPIRGNKVDANQADIVRDLLAIGASVEVLSDIGGGCPDLLVGWRGKNKLFEVKNPAQSPSKRKLTPAEEKWHAAWHGNVEVIETIEDALKILRSWGEAV